MPVHVNTDSVDIRLFTANDVITLEYDDSITLMFVPGNPFLLPGLEDIGQYIRNVSLVNIIDNDSKICFSLFTKDFIILCDFRA